MNSLADEPKTEIAARDKLIVALDVSTRAEAISLALELAPFAGWMKIGLQLFIAEGPDVVRAVRETGANVFLDLKLHDIPNTVARAVASAARLDVAMLTLHLSGGAEMLRAASGAAPPSMLLLGVTVLTSADEQTLRRIGISESVADHVLRLAQTGVENGMRGVVASAREIAMLREKIGPRVKLVAPGIRARDANAHDQKRTMSAGEALAAGADFLVIGRPITGAENPRNAARKILEEMGN